MMCRDQSPGQGLATLTTKPGGAWESQGKRGWKAAVEGLPETSPDEREGSPRVWPFHQEHVSA